MRRSLCALLLGCALGVLPCAQAADPAPAPASTPAAVAAPAVAALAAPAAPAPRAQQVQIGATPSAGSLMQTIFALTFVLGLLAALAWLMKRYGPRGGPGGGVLRVVGALSLGGREKVMVLEVGDQWIVVGASPGRVNALATLPRPEGASVPAHAELPTSPSFAAWLKQTIDNRNAK
jgi:flagellar protein FliO/FliZ